MESLSDDILSEILVRHPIETLCRLKCVSKPLNTHIKSPDFTKLYDKLHFHQTDGIKLIVVGKSSLRTLNIGHKNSPRPLDLGLHVNNTQLVGSSNGLVCLYHSPNSYSLLNPTTRELRVLPDPGTFPIRLSGFGYVPLLDDFMVVSAAVDEFPPVVKVYSAKADSWEAMPAGVELPAYDFTFTVSVHVNGVAHWLGWTGGKDSRVRTIMGFDFANKEFKLLPLHEDINRREIMAFSVLDKCLCVLAQDADLSVEMWVMNKYGVVESWEETLSFGTTFLSIFPTCDQGNRVLFEINDQILLYYKDSGLSRVLEVRLWRIGETEGGVLHIARYEDSLVSPSGYISQDIRQIPNYVAEENQGDTPEMVDNPTNEAAYDPFNDAKRKAKSTATATTVVQSCSHCSAVCKLLCIVVVILGVAFFMCFGRI